MFSFKKCVRFLGSASGSKPSSSEVLKHEIFSNPEFDTAFPHLKGKKPEIAFKTRKFEYDYIRSLLYARKGVNELPQTRQIKENEKTFSEGFRSHAGPFKLMSREEIDLAHIEAERQMDVLERTRMSRNEILNPNSLVLFLISF